MSTTTTNATTVRRSTDVELIETKKNSVLNEKKTKEKGEGKLSSGMKKQLGESVVEINNLQKWYELEGRKEHVTALKMINLHSKAAFGAIRRGEFVMIRGPSGGGKTTLLNIIGTLDYPTSGSIHVFGKVIDKDSKDHFLADLRLKKIGFVFQTFNLLVTMSAFENVELPMLTLGKLTSQEIKERTLKLLEMVGLRDRAQHLPSELSGGEQQRVTVARALANKPDILLLDEPTGDLDTRNTLDIMDLLLKINQSDNTTCIMVTHNSDLECYADRILYVEDGQFVKQILNEEQSALQYDSYISHMTDISS